MEVVMKAANMLPPMTLLVIEDSRADAALLQAYFANDPEIAYRLLIASDIEQARAFMAEVAIDVVLLDLFLPDTEGLSGLSCVRAMLPDVPVLILTGRDDDKLALQAVEAGAQDYILKDSLTARSIKRSVAYALQRKKHLTGVVRGANFDALTQLPNRANFMSRLSVALDRQQRTRLPLAVMMLDLNGFKEINDNHGHQCGDRVLSEVGRRLTACLRPYDVAARFGGDEFLILIEDIGGTRAASAVARQLALSIGRPMADQGAILPVGVSIGVAIAHADEEADAELLLRRADQMMYLAKSSGNNMFRIYDEMPTPYLLKSA